MKKLLTILCFCSLLAYGQNTIGVPELGKNKGAANGYPLLDPAAKVPIPSMRGQLVRVVSALANDEVDNRLVGQTAGTKAQNLFSTRNDATRTYVRSATSIVANVDLTCVSVWNSTADIRQTVTLVAPDVGICANHYEPAFVPGNTVRFVDKNNAVVTLTVSSEQQVGSTDIEVVGFTKSTPSTITPARVLTNAAFLSMAKVIVPVVFTNQNEQVFVGDLIDANGDVIPPTETNRIPFNTVPILGDSGHPLFVLLDNQPILIGTWHSTGNGPPISNNIAAVNAAMASVGSANRLSYYKINAANDHRIPKTIRRRRSRD